MGKKVERCKKIVKLWAQYPFKTRHFKITEEFIYFYLNLFVRRGKWTFRLTGKRALLTQEKGHF